jgi:transcriptional regulator NrdR family protein
MEEIKMGDQKTPEEYASKELNKSLGKAIASRQLEIKRLEAKIKKINKEIEKIKNMEEEDKMENSEVFKLEYINKEVENGKNKKV